MSLRRTCGISIAVISAGLQCAHAQQAVSSVEHARLHQALPTATTPRVDANGTALRDEETTSDDSFGKQVILTSPPRIRTFVLTGDASVFYTNNAALTRRDTIDDVFFVANAGISWIPVIAPRLAAQIGAYGSIFRYDRTPSLDFQSFGAGAGLSWNPDHFAGIGLFARYDFIEMLDRHSEEILRDHEFTFGAQKVFPLGRAQSLSVGTIFMAGLAEPESAQRDQAGVFLGYRVDLTRSFGIELLYRFAGYFYNDTGRIDRNQIFSAGLYYRVQEWASINAFVSLTDNQSDDSAYEYSAVSNGGGLSASVQF